MQCLVCILHNIQPLSCPALPGPSISFHLIRSDLICQKLSAATLRSLQLQDPPDRPFVFILRYSAAQTAHTDRTSLDLK